jgi:predicted ATPase
MTFHEPMLEEILAEPVDPAVFERLAEAAMIVPTDAIDGWRFCHPLIHDAAYRSLLATDRTILHTRVADRLEVLQPDRLVGTIALHRAAAGDSVRAIPLLLRAAEMAAGMAAPTEAADYLETAAGLEPDPDVAAELRRRATEARGMALVG